MPRRVRARAVSVRYLFPQHDVADDVENDDDDGDDDEAPRLLSLLLIMIIEVVALIFAHMRPTLCLLSSPSLPLSVLLSIYTHIFMIYVYDLVQLKNFNA